MKVLVINGVNLNMLGVREPALYGSTGYKQLVKMVKARAKELFIKVKFFQSNCEGEICTRIQKALDKFDAIVINAGAYTHTSIAILDALKAVDIPVVEVHITDINGREEFRKHSYISQIADKIIVGKGLAGYTDALEYLASK